MSLQQRRIRPPRFAIWLLKSFCSYDYLSTSLWDLEELFEENVKEKGLWRAKWLYWKEACSIIYYLYLKGKSHYSFNTISMLKNNVVYALRNLRKNRIHT
ncbi:MAG: permease prefix domain 2-containing transporter, partial [Bacteroidota bacterium]